MPKNRIIPFGYCMRNGEITVDFNESKAVARIFEEYLNGSSLQQIAKLMESEKVQYSDISDRWNKNMVKRIIENEKYLGNEKYPQIIGEKFFTHANEKKNAESHFSLCNSGRFTGNKKPYILLRMRSQTFKNRWQQSL